MSIFYYSSCVLLFQYFGGLGTRVIVDRADELRTPLQHILVWVLPEHVLHRTCRRVTQPRYDV
jgi:hypothetical protein